MTEYEDAYASAHAYAQAAGGSAYTAHRAGLQAVVDLAREMEAPLDY